MIIIYPKPKTEALMKAINALEGITFRSEFEHYDIQLALNELLQKYEDCKIRIDIGLYVSERYQGRGDTLYFNLRTSSNPQPTKEDEHDGKLLHYTELKVVRIGEEQWKIDKVIETETIDVSYLYA